VPDTAGRVIRFPSASVSSPTERSPARNTSTIARRLGSPRASKGSLWAILTDAPGYPAWDSGVERVEGSIAPGEKIKVRSKANPGRAFPVKVTDPLAPGTDGTTRFTMREEYTGPLLPLIWRSMPDLGPSFRQFASGLTKRAER
jgi:hypothetical protein